MSNVHVLDKQGQGWRVALHVAVPGGNNSAGVAWSSVALKSGRAGTTVLADGTGSDGGIASAEKASIVAGTVVEVLDVAIPPSDAVTLSAINAWLDAYYAAKSAEVLAGLSAQLAQFGRTR